MLRVEEGEGSNRPRLMLAWLEGTWRRILVMFIHVLFDSITIPVIGNIYIYIYIYIFYIDLVSVIK